MLENLLVTFRKRLFLLLLLMELGFINQRTDDAQGLGSTLCIFSYTGVVQPAPTGLATRIVEVPAIVELQTLRLACPEIQDAVDYQVKVVRIDMLFKALDTDALVGQHFATHLDDMLVGDIIDNHIVSTDFQRLFHQVVSSKPTHDFLTAQTTKYIRE